MINGAKYNFYQVHWHTPSENTVDGESFPLEAHFVHQLDDEALVGGYHRLAVIGLLYELGECNEFLDYFWNEFPEKKGQAAYEGMVLDFNTKLATELEQGYYHWYGSLTTPPCTEGVNWNLLKVTQTVCQRQVDKLKNAMYGTEFNNRVTMPLNHRVVTLSGGLALEGNPEVSSDSTWKYANDDDTAANAAVQTATWGGLCSTGREQSPINVVTADVADSCLGSGDGMMVSSAMTMETHYTAALSYVKHTGYAFQLFETSPHTHELDNLDEVQVMAEGQPKGHSMVNGAKYNFYQVHWHAPSENTVDGKSFPLEAHFVHQLDDDALVGTYHRLAVIGLLYELGDECNTFLDQFWEAFPEKKGIAPYLGEDVDFNAKLEEALAEGYYHWYGSLTTPPCTEGVSWNLLKKTQTVCQRQIDVIKAALGETQSGVEFNNRVVQPLNQRVVTFVPNDGAERVPPVVPADTKWKYANDGETEANGVVQTATWGGECATGHEQSPIDVVTADAVFASGSGKPTITTHFSAALTYVKHTGYALQLFETSPHTHGLNELEEVQLMAEGQPKGYSMINGDKYNFYQVHWHTPSENTVNGVSFPLEAHFVHQLDDPALVGGYNRLAVIGLLYELGECNEFLDYFWNEFPEKKGQAAYNGEDIDLNEKLADELSEGYYHWWGSLTTPPCTEGVSWNLLRQVQTVCQRQIDLMKDALAAGNKGIAFNNRVPQPLNHRVVSVSMGDGKWLYAEKGEIVANAAVQEKTWGGLCFAGREQSPIDIVTDETVASNIIPDGAKTVAAISTHYTAALEYVKNRGYSLQLFETSPKTHDLNAEGEVVYMADGQPKGYAMINSG